MNILVIPEDPRKDKLVLKPIITAMMRFLNKPHANVLICEDPILGGVDEALKWERIREIIEMYDWGIDLFLLCIDRDGQAGRRVRLNEIETLATGILKSDHCFLAENAWQEIEIWVLAGHNLPREWNWSVMRSEATLKETYFEPFIDQRSLVETLGGGRKRLAEEAAHHYRRIRQRCPEDIGALEGRIREWLGKSIKSITVG